MSIRLYSFYIRRILSFDLEEGTNLTRLKLGPIIEIASSLEKIVELWGARWA